MRTRSKQKKAARQAMQTATDYATWRQAADALDRLTERQSWMQNDDSHWYDAGQVRASLLAMRRARQAKDPLKVMSLIQEGLDQHGAGVVHPRLYCETYSGESKDLPRQFLQEAARGLLYLADEQREGYPDRVKLQLFEQGAHKFGRSALMLSGGATMGIYHLGVVKEIFLQKLLPRILSGSSMGAIVAAGACSRTDEELRDFFEHPEQIHRQAMRLKPLLEITRQRSLFDPERLIEHVRANLKADMTFAEAHQRSGRVLNISVSPARSSQKPRILCHATAPDLLISYSAAASCAMPFLYPPAMLMSRGDDGQAQPYLPEERWLDGSVAGDLPMNRVSRLHNVNHFIVSQTNPHVYLLVSRSETPSLPYVGFEIAGSLLRSQAKSLLGSFRKLVHNEHLRPTLDQLHSLASQDYLGDINIHPRVDPRMLRKFVSNPTPADIEHFILGGQRVTWPRVAMIRDQTLISRTFEQILQKLKKRVETGANPEA